MLRPACADYDTITIWTEVNGHMEPLTDPWCIYDDVLADWKRILIVVVLGFLHIPSTEAISSGWLVVLYKVYL